VVLTTTASRIAREEAGFGKIDPLMALFNAAHLMSSIRKPAAVRVRPPWATAKSRNRTTNPRRVACRRGGDPARSAHPRWQEMRERFEARLAANDRDDLYA
jgi:hypothetical protein